MRRTIIDYYRHINPIICIKIGERMHINKILISQISL